MSPPPSYPEDKPQIILSYGDRMDDRDYAKVLDELLWCESEEKKAEIIAVLLRQYSNDDFLTDDREITIYFVLLYYKEEPLWLSRAVGYYAVSANIANR